MRPQLISTLLLGLLLLTACKSERSDPPQLDLPMVMVSVAPQALFVERIAGTLVKPEVMVRIGDDHGVYEPTIQQMRAVAKSRAYFKVGHPKFVFEQKWLNRLALENNDMLFIDTALGIDVLDDDPHTWTSPQAVRIMARNIADGLVKLLPAHQMELEANLARFVSDIDNLDRYITKLLSNLRHRKFLVFHPAWGYLAHQYGLEQIALEHEGKEPSAPEIANIVALAKREGIKVILAQPQFSTVSAELLAREISGRVVLVDPVSHDWFNNLRLVAETIAGADSRN